MGLRVNEEVGLSFWEWVQEVVGLSMGESGIEYGIKWDWVWEKVELSMV